MFLRNGKISTSHILLKLPRLNSHFHRNYSKQELKWSTEEIRQKYLQFFCSQNGHKFIKSSSVLPKKGSGTYFTNAGMNQFKSIILGESQADKIIDFTRYNGVANSQKCIRIGGKHSDLDDIGKDTYHHTFFEMLGNWSFGNYDKETACKLALDLLVNVYKLNINGLYFTYFRGDEKFSLKPDLETKRIWLKLGVAEDRILPFGMKENFWEMDSVGPCGPCTEIHYDRNFNFKKNGGDLVNAGTERVIELWNLVFMQFNRVGPRSFSRLPNLVVDTGMGLERLSAVLNNLNSNYETDLFMPMFDYIHEFTKNNQVPEYLKCVENDRFSYGYKVLGDHMRSITVAISDGLVPSRNGLGGFLKFLILKNLKICNEIFGVRKNEDACELLCDLVPCVVDSLKNGHPDLVHRTEYVQKVIRSTEKLQKQKLNSYEEITERFLRKLNNPTRLSGEQVWKLFKGDGSGEEISTDFIKNYCDQKKIDLDLEQFDRIYLSENEKALRNMKNVRKDNTVYIEMASRLREANVPPTNNSFVYSFNLDTENNLAQYFNPAEKDVEFNAKIVGVFAQNSDAKYEMVTSLNSANSDCIVVLDRTIFYPESGGQQSDKGSLIKTNNSTCIQIEQVLHIQGYTFHIGKFNSKGDLVVLNDSVECQIDKVRRYETSMNHTAVHLLNHSMRKHFGAESSVIQLNSIVKNNSLKFEFSFSERLEKPSLNDLKSIENLCNSLINSELPVFINENVNYDEKNEKLLSYPVRVLKDVLYPLSVRAVTIGEKWQGFFSANKNGENSGEFCCGTHATNLKQLREFVITGFSMNGDSTFELDACTLNNAKEARENDHRVRTYFDEMVKLHEFKEKNGNELSINELNSVLNQIADRSILIESIFKSSLVSYLTMQRVKQEAVKYRPSKSKLIDVLKRFFEQEISEGLNSAQFATVITSLKPKSTVSFKFLAFDSCLSHEQILLILKKMKNLYPALILFNKYRGNYIFYSRDEIEKNGELSAYFADVVRKILAENVNASMVDEKANYKVLKCPVLNNQREYFCF